MILAAIIASGCADARVAQPGLSLDSVCMVSQYIGGCGYEQAVYAANDWSRCGRRVSGNWPAVDENQKNLRACQLIVVVMTFRGIRHSTGIESRGLHIPKAMFVWRHNTA